MSSVITQIQKPYRSGQTKSQINKNSGSAIRSKMAPTYQTNTAPTYQQTNTLSFQDLFVFDPILLPRNGFPCFVLPDDDGS